MLNGTSYTYDLGFRNTLLCYMMIHKSKTLFLTVETYNPLTQLQIQCQCKGFLHCHVIACMVKLLFFIIFCKSHRVIFNSLTVKV